MIDCRTTNVPVAPHGAVYSAMSRVDCNLIELCGKLESLEDALHPVLRRLNPVPVNPAATLAPASDNSVVADRINDLADRLQRQIDRVQDILNRIDL